MSTELEKLFDGSYTYMDKGVHYSQENFTVHKDAPKNILIFSSEILTRVTTGEFLKINVNYEVNSFWAPIRVTIHKTLGPNFATETFLADYDNQQLLQEFTNSKGTQRYSANIVTKFQIATPAIASSMMLTLTRKFDTNSRNACILVSSKNNWDWVDHWFDKTVFIDYKSHESCDLNINGQHLNAMKCIVYENDSLHQSDEEVPTTFYLSKHIGIPYMVECGDLKIQVRYLNKLKTSVLEDIFKKK